MDNLRVDDVVALAKHVHHQKGKYIKSTLSRLEAQQDNVALDHEVRKIILDNFNDFARAVLESVGYRVEL